jgi:C4-type Zn-finger protein
MKPCERYMDQRKFVSVRCPICGSDAFNNMPMMGKSIPLDFKTNYHICFSCANCRFQMKIDLRRVSASNNGKEVKE